MTIKHDNPQVTSSQPQWIKDESTGAYIENKNVPSVSSIYTTTPHSFSEWWDGSVDTRNYIRHGSNYAQIIGGGARSLNRAHRTFTHVAPQLYKPQSDKSMARLDNNYNLDESWFNAAAEDLSNQWSNIEQKYQEGKISDKRLVRLADRHKQKYENLAENRLSWDQKNHPYRYVQPHKPGDIAPALFSIGLPLAIIGSISGAASLAPHAWRILNNPIVQALGTYSGIKNFFSENGINKTINHIRNGEYWQAGLSGLGDAIDILPVGVATGSAIRGVKNLGKGLNTWDWLKQTFNHTDTVKAINWLQGATTGKVKTSGVLPSDATKMFEINPWLDTIEDASGRTYKAKFGKLYDHNGEWIYMYDSIFDPIRQKRHYSINDFDDINYAADSYAKKIDTSKLPELLNNATKEQIASLRIGGSGELSLIPLWKNHLLQNNDASVSFQNILVDLDGLPDSRFIIESSKLLPKFDLKPYTLSNAVLGAYKNNKKYISHSVTSDNFKQTLKNFNGVVPMPSLGVFPTDVINGFNQFYRNNSILIFGNPNMLKASKLYRGDGYTPTIRTAYERNANMNDVDDVFNKMLKGYEAGLKPVSLNKFLTSPFQSVDGIKNPTNTILKWADNNLKPGEHLYDYFEAKYMDKWPLNTSAGMIIPSNDTEIIDWVTQNGVPYKVYDVSDPKAYDDAVRKFLEEHPELVFTDKIK